MKRLLAGLAASRRRLHSPVNSFSQEQLAAWAAQGLYPVGGSSRGVVLLPFEEPLDAPTSTEVPLGDWIRDYSLRDLSGDEP